MKKNQNDKPSTPSDTPAQSGRPISDINHNKKYEVTLFWAQYNQAKVIIEAGSLPEAEEKADEIESGDVDWNPVQGNLQVDSVEPVSEGQNHD